VGAETRVENPIIIAESFAAVFSNRFLPKPLSSKPQGERIMATTILRLPKVIERVGFARSSIYALISSGRFPAPIKIGPRAVGWLNSDIDAWINACVERTKRLDRQSKGGAK
jgi:prophage regulatory protein